MTQHPIDKNSLSNYLSNLLMIGIFHNNGINSGSLSGSLARLLKSNDRWNFGGRRSSAGSRLLARSCLLSVSQCTSLLLWQWSVRLSRGLAEFSSTNLYLLRTVLILGFIYVTDPEVAKSYQQQENFKTQVTFYWLSKKKLSLILDLLIDKHQKVYMKVKYWSHNEK